MSDVIPVGALTVARPLWWQDPYGVLLRTAVIVGWLPGFALGLVLLLELALLQRVGVGWWPHAQTHAHAQIYGFVGLFFFGVATQILPRFLGRPLEGRAIVSLGGLLLGTSLIGRLSVQPFPSGSLRDTCLHVAAWVGLLGGLVIFLVFARNVALTSRPRERWHSSSDWGSHRGCWGYWPSSGPLLCWLRVRCSYRSRSRS